MNSTIKFFIVTAFFMFSRLDATTWGSVSNISPSFLINTVPQVASDPNGNAMAVWESDTGTGKSQIQACYYTAGTGWNSSPTPLSSTSTPGGNAFAPWVTMDNLGNAMAIWQRNNGSKFVIQAAYYTQSTSTWSSPVNISTVTQQCLTPQIVFNNSGNAIAIWRNTATQTIQTAAYTKIGNTWSGVSNVSGAVTATKPYLAINTAGEAIAVWLGNVGGLTAVQANFFNGSSWNGATSISNLSIDSSNASVDIDQAGNGIAIWSDTNDQINIATYDKSLTTWSSPVIISSTSMASKPSISIIPSSGDAIAIWSNFDGTIHLAETATYTFSTTTWSTPATISNNTGSVDDQKVATYSNGNGVAIWSFFDGTYYIIESSTYDSSLSTWSSPVSLSASSNYADLPGIFVNPAAGTFNAFGIWRFTPDNTNYTIQAIIGS